MYMHVPCLNQYRLIKQTYLQSVSTDNLYRVGKHSGLSGCLLLVGFCRILYVKEFL